MYIELHARSAFSFLRASSQPEEIAVMAAALGMPAFALTDRDGVYGSARAHYAAKEIGKGECAPFNELMANRGKAGHIGGKEPHNAARDAAASNPWERPRSIAPPVSAQVRALVGAEITLRDESVLPVLVRTREGYQNLCQMLTRAHLRSAKGEGRVEWEELAEFAGGLVCLTGDEEGGLRQAVARDDRPGAEKVLGRLVQIFGGDGVYVELQRHGIRGEDWANTRLAELAEAARLPLLATNGVCYARPAGRLVHDAFTCLRHHTTLDAAGCLLTLNSQRCLKSPREMREIFADRPEAIENTLRLAERLEFTLENLGYQFPRMPTREGEDMAQALARETYAGAERLYRDRGGITAPLRALLEKELRIIEKLGFCGYFLLIHGILQHAQEAGIMVQGRGSAANSAVCFCLGITKVDPTKQHLLFERFLSEGRKGWPDVDLDLPSGDRREALIQHVYQKFAPRGAAMTANVICYRGRSAMREMGKVLGLPEDALGRFSDLFANGDFPHTMGLNDQLEKAGLQRHHPRLPALCRLYRAVHGLPRHLGQHSGGMIISDRPLDTVVPLENASMPDRVVVQWDKDDCEDLGIIKVDFLGLGMMAVVQDTLELCRARGRPVDWEHLSETEDPATYDMMQRADTIGVFQIESRAQMATLPRLKPNCFYDVAVEVAIIRPGPIVGDLAHPYMERRAGREAVDFIHPMFQPILERTLGVPLFQEQVLEMAMLIAGFSGTEAEELRRAMSFHRSEERMRKVTAKLYAAMDQRGIDLEVQRKVVKAIQSFALYGFPESHAISFALIAYGSTWLKVHRPAEFFVGLLNNQPMGFYSRSTLVFDARAHGVRVRPVCVTRSSGICEVVDDRVIRLGLNQVRGLNAASRERILAERERAPFTNLTDFLLRTLLKHDERRMLAKVGALNALLPPDRRHRREALWEVERHLDPDDLFSYAARKQWSVVGGQCSDGLPKAIGAENGSAVCQPLPTPPVSPLTTDHRPLTTFLAPLQPIERLEMDYHGLGLTTGPHPMSFLRESLPEVYRACDLPQMKHGQRVTIAGLVICRQRPGTAKGHVFISLEDETGITNAFVPSDTFERYRLTITQETFLRITGGLQLINNVISIYATEITALPDAATVGYHSYDFH